MAGRKTDYSFEEIDLALTAFALEGGRMRAVERLLLDAGLDIPWDTVRKWAYSSHHERYERIATEVEKQVRARLADNYHRLSVMSAELSEDVLRRINDEFDRRDNELERVTQRLAEVEARIDVLRRDDTDEADDERKRLEAEQKQLWTIEAACRANLKELAKVLHESAVMGGVSTEKHAMLTGRPTQIVEHDFPEIRAALERKGVRLQVGQGPPSSSAVQGPASAPVPVERRLPPADEGDGAGTA